MPHFDTPRQNLSSLKDACPWEITSLENFAPNADLLSLGVSERDQKVLFLIKASRNMRRDGLSNNELDKAHPAVIQDNVARLSAKEFSVCL